MADVPYKELQLDGDAVISPNGDFILQQAQDGAWTVSKTVPPQLPCESVVVERWHTDQDLHVNTIVSTQGGGYRAQWYRGKPGVVTGVVIGVIIVLTVIFFKINKPHKYK
jgi:hypothetical protein